jgi:hypothetical protein
MAILRNCVVSTCLFALLLVVGCNAGQSNVLLGWGSNDRGELSQGSDNPSELLSPTPLIINTTGLNNQTIAQLAAGYFHYCALTTSNQIWCWGYNNEGETGQSTNTDEYIYNPVQVNQSGVLLGKTIVTLKCGTYSCAVLDSAGRLYTWGYDGYAQLGDGDAGYDDQYDPVAVAASSFGNAHVVDFGIGYYLGCAALSDGNAFWWGYTDEDNDTYSYSPLHIAGTGAGGVFVKNVSCGERHVLLLTNTSKLYAIGYNVDGEFGDGTYNSNYTNIVAVNDTLFSGKSIVSMATDYYNLILTSDNKIYGWGEGGAIGDGTDNDYNSPVLANMTAFGGKTLVQVFANDNYDSAALASDGTFFIWGEGVYPGDGTGDDDWYSPLQVPNLVVTGPAALAEESVVVVGRSGTPTPPSAPMSMPVSPTAPVNMPTSTPKAPVNMPTSSPTSSPKAAPVNVPASTPVAAPSVSSPNAPRSAPSVPSAPTAPSAPAAPTSPSSPHATPTAPSAAIPATPKAPATSAPSAGVALTVSMLIVLAASICAMFA